MLFEVQVLVLGALLLDCECGLAYVQSEGKTRRDATWTRFHSKADGSLQKACMAIMAFLVFDFLPEPLGLPAFLTPVVLAALASALALGVAVLVVVAAIANILQ